MTAAGGLDMAENPGRSRTVDPELELIFLLAGTCVRRAALEARTRHALSRAHFGRLASELTARRLLPLVGSRALATASDLCSESFRSTVAERTTAARARGLAVEAATRTLSARLAEAGIPALPLKGPLLAEAAHGDVGLRDTDDVDLLVPRARLHDAARLLARDGFQEPADPLRANGLPDLHLALHRADFPAVELHWRVHWHEEAFSDGMLSRAQPDTDGLLRALPEDLVASLLLFYARDGFHGVRLGADIAAWWDRHGQALPPRFLEGHARRHPQLAAALTAAAAVTEDLTGAPAREWLGSGAVRSRRVGLAARLADWTQVGDRDQLAANVSLADAILAPPGSGPTMARRELVPRSGGTAAHAAKMLARYALALWRLRGNRRWSAPPRENPARVELFGIPLDAMTEADAIGHVMGSLAAGRGGWAATANLDHLRQFAGSGELSSLFEEPDFVVPDGMPLAWASRLAGTPLPGRVAGSDLIWSLTAEAALRGRSVFLLGGAPGACDRAADTMRVNYPGLRIAGVHSPPYGFEHDRAASQAIRDALRAARPDIVFVGLGFPKQEQLIQALRGEFAAAWFLAVGISFSFIAGDLTRAPDWLQRIGLEWAHRLALEPRRLARRYLIHDLPFAVRLGVHSLAARRRGGLRARPLASPRLGVVPTRVTFTHGALERRRAADLRWLGLDNQPDQT
jgi:N-acetylglucosaminyldiphosphoundecaprenol N-acetyl-beta-D-mannosaminyltransferase